MDRLAELREDWKYLIRRDGVKSALPVVGLEISRLPYRHLRYIIVARSLVETWPNLQPKIALEIRPFEHSDLALAREMNRPSEAKLYARRLALGQRGVIALHKGQPAGYAWGCSEMNPKLERVPLRLEAGDILCTDVYTVPTFRDQGIQTALTLARFQMFRNLGYRRAVSYIETNNGPSLAVWQRKLASLAIGRVDFIRMGPWYKVRCDY